MVWMTLKDLKEYLQVPESRIRQLIKHGNIPHYNNHGLLRFHREEIDAWMKTPPTQQASISAKEIEKEAIMYRGQPIRSYKLSASTILIGLTPMSRLPHFIQNFIQNMQQRGIEYLERKGFASLGENNYMDYLRLSCQLGLIEKRKEAGDGRRVHYYPTEYANRIYNTQNNDEIKLIIRESILNSVKHRWDIDPGDVKHAIVLLWYILTLRSRGVEISEDHFKVDSDETDNYYPRIRLNYISGLREFLFGDDMDAERDYLQQWDQFIGNAPAPQH